MENQLRLRLREATQADHQRLEDELDLFSRISSLSGRRDLVARFAGLHAAAEAALGPHLMDLEGLDFAARRRSPRLDADLANLGGRSDIAPQRISGCDSLGAALGWMYVLEGSTLGGRVIRRQVEANGGDMAGLSFLDPYGEQTGERWRSFLSVLEQQGADNQVAEAAIAGARAGFRHALAVLCTAGVAA